MSSVKPSNPKEVFASRKIPLTSVQTGPFTAEMALGMLEGALKYGRHNYRDTGVLASSYVDAAVRHLLAYWEGEDMDADAAIPIHNLAKAACCLQILFDGIARGNITDDRPPPPFDPTWLKEFNARSNALRDKLKDVAKPPVTRKKVP